MTRDELIDLISDVTTMLGTALAQHVELTESIEGAGVESQKLKLDALKAKLAGERLKLAKLKNAAKRKRELEERRKENEAAAAKPNVNEGRKSGMVTLRNAAGGVVGYMRVMGPNQTDFFDRTGKLVAREVDSFTYSRGRVVFKGRLGLVALGVSLR